jgi:prepilin-type processing-associated H-X9-DG protein
MAARCKNNSVTNIGGVSGIGDAQSRLRGACARGVMLLEVLVVVAIIGLLLGILSPAISHARSAMKQMKCSSNMRAVAIDFQFFADGQSPSGKGDSQALGAGRFRINDYQDYLYRLDEFWDLGDQPNGTLSVRKELMMCAAGPSQLTKKSGLPCGSEAIAPPSDVSIAINMRLYRAVVQYGSASLLSPVAATHLRSNVLDHPYAPLLIDVDGEEAVRRNLEPFYTAPPRRGEDGPYADGHYWMPSARHSGRTNVAFVGGHVLSSKRPEKEPWNWGLQAHVGQ